MYFQLCQSKSFPKRRMILLYLILCYVSLIPGLAACDSQWVYFESNCYFFSVNTKENIDATSDCHDRQALLAKIDNQDELNFITSLTKYDELRLYKYYIQGFCYSGSCLGADYTDATGHLLNFVKWKPGEPSASYQECIVLVLEKSASYNLTDRQMADQTCSNGYHYICKKQNEDTTVTSPITTSISTMVTTETTTEASTVLTTAVTMETSTLLTTIRTFLTTPYSTAATTDMATAGLSRSTGGAISTTSQNSTPLLVITESTLKALPTTPEQNDTPTVPDITKETTNHMPNTIYIHEPVPFVTTKTTENSKETVIPGQQSFVPVPRITKFTPVAHEAPGSVVIGTLGIIIFCIIIGCILFSDLSTIRNQLKLMKKNVFN